MPMGAVDIVSRALCRYRCGRGERKRRGTERERDGERKLNSVSCCVRVHRVAANWLEENGE